MLAFVEDECEPPNFRLYDASNIAQHLEEATTDPCSRAEIENIYYFAVTLFNGTYSTLFLVNSYESDESAQLASYATEAYEGNSESAYICGKVFQRKNDSLRATRFFRLAAESNHPKALYRLGDDLSLQLSARANFWKACNDLAVAALNRGSFDEGKKLLDQKSIGAASYFNLGQLLRRDGYGITAKSMYQRASILGCAAGALNLGVMLWNGGERSEALIWLSKTAVTAYRLALSNLAQALQTEGRLKESLKIWTKLKDSQKMAAVHRLIADKLCPKRTREEAFGGDEILLEFQEGFLTVADSKLHLLPLDLTGLLGSDTP
ncbi:MAG: hypothetical protein KDK48_02195 [Chlamydiia bacterium]|nr:hypothetical protein [Chlamydiia bacterium]